MTRTTSFPAGLAAIALAAAATLVPAHAATLLATDTSWKVTTIAPGPEWLTLAHDTSAWEWATPLYDVSDHLGPAYSAKGIWTSGGQFSTTETAIWGYRVLNLAALPVTASLEGGFDDDVDVWINGTLVVSDHNGIANGVGVADLLPFLQLGDNVIAFAATDNYPVYGYNHAAWLQIDGQLAPAIPEPETYALMLAGLAATALVARRRRQPR